MNGRPIYLPVKCIVYRKKKSRLWRWIGAGLLVFAVLWAIW